MNQLTNSKLTVQLLSNVLELSSDQEQNTIAIWNAGSIQSAVIH